MTRFLPNNQQHIKGQVETLRDETRGLRIDYANTCYNLAQLRCDHAQLSYDHAHLSNNFQQLWNEWDANLEKREAEKEKMVVDWETRSRIAQGEFLPYVVSKSYMLF
jgi:uncharacterized lipoprotein